MLLSVIVRVGLSGAPDVYTPGEVNGPLQAPRLIESDDTPEKFIKTVGKLNGVETPTLTMKASGIGSEAASNAGAPIVVEAVNKSGTSNVKA